MNTHTIIVNDIPTGTNIGMFTALLDILLDFTDIEDCILVDVDWGDGKKIRLIPTTTITTKYQLLNDTDETQVILFDKNEPLPNIRNVFNTGTFSIKIHIWRQDFITSDTKIYTLTVIKGSPLITDTSIIVASKMQDIDSKQLFVQYQSEQGYLLTGTLPLRDE